MIISFNPIIPGDIFIWDKGCITNSLLHKIKNAKAIILSQTVSPELYYLAKSSCAKVFPNYDYRFKWQGKIGDTLLFWHFGVKHPNTWIFPKVEAFIGDHPEMGYKHPKLKFPYVIKANKGGEGSSIYLIENEGQLKDVLALLRKMEWQGRAGFVAQEFIPDINKDLRVVVIGDYITSYWRNSSGFHKNIAKGGIIDKTSESELQEIGRKTVKKFCAKTGINLAGFDLIFPPQKNEPLFIEINYTFGRCGLGGSEKFYKILKEQVKRFLEP